MKVILWALFVLLLFTPMIAEFAFVSDILPTAQRIFVFWKNKTEAVFLSDILFVEAGVLILFGALVAGTILYNSWAALDVRKAQYTEYIWNWRQMKKERESSSGLKAGLAILAVGIVYAVVAILLPVLCNA